MWTRRQLIDGIRWRTRTGDPWRDVPERYGPWERVHDQFRRWQRDGTWSRVLTQLRCAAPAARRWGGEKGDLQKELPGAGNGSFGEGDRIGDRYRGAGAGQAVLAQRFVGIEPGLRRRPGAEVLRACAHQAHCPQPS
ncbi:transposase [Streptomyces sp. NPDC002835]